MATTAELIEKVKTQMSAVLDADPATMKYKIGGKSVDKTAYLQYLTELLTKLESSPPDPNVEFMAFDFKISDFGEDLGEYVE